MYRSGKTSPVKVNVVSLARTNKNVEVPNSVNKEKRVSISKRNFYVLNNKPKKTEDVPDESIPSKIEGKYNSDFNILWIHRVIVSHFNIQKKRLPRSIQNLEYEKELYEKATTIIDKNSIRKTINELEKHIYEISNDKKKNEYLEKVTDYLREYQKLRPQHRVVYFGKKKKIEEDEDDETVKNRVILISNYIDIAGEYYDIDVRRVKTKNSLCQVCGADIAKVGVDNDGVLECICGYEYVTYSKESMYKDTARLESTRSDGNYQDRENFEKAIDNFGCKQEDNLPQGLEDAINSYMTSYGFLSAEEIRKLPLNKDGSRGNTSIELLTTILKSTGYSEYYDNVRLILYKIWGWEKKDISHLKEILMADYDKTQRVYVTIEKDRKSSLNSQYRLFRHLQANNYPCTIDDFRVVRTPSILNEHDKLWSIMCKETKYPLILKYK